MKKIILMSLLFSLNVYSAGEEGTGNQPQNNNTQENATEEIILCMSSFNSNNQYSSQEHYQHCLLLTN